jgi:exopolysaccharide production protein ExoQ
MSSSTLRYVPAATLVRVVPWGEAEPSRPVYNYLHIWILLLPILYLAANGQLSITNFAANNGQMTQNGALLRTSQGIRPQIILYFLAMPTYLLLGYKSILRVAVANRWLLLAPAYAALTALWSADPLLTLRAAFELCMTTWFAFYLAERFSTERLMRILIFAGVVAAIASLLLVAFLPSAGVYQRDGSRAWQGICNHKNFLGVAMAFLLTPIFYTRANSLFKICYAGLLLFLIVMSQSRGAWFITFGMLALVAWIRFFRRLRNNEKLLITLLSLLIAVGLVTVSIMYIGPLMSSIGKDPTMTGRTDIYVAVFKSILKKPFTGYGFGAFWFGINPESNNVAFDVHWPSIGYAENGLLEMWLELGAIGLLLILAPVVRAIQLCVRLLRSPFYNPRIGWFTTILFLELISNIEAGAILTPVTLNWTLTIIAVVGIMKEYRQYTRTSGTVQLPIATPLGDYASAPTP